MKASNLSPAQLQDSHVRSTFFTVKVLVNIYLCIRLVTLPVLYAIRNNPKLATQDAWVHGIIVGATALLTAYFMIQFTRGSRRGYLRLRIISAIMLLAIVIIIAIPGLFPLWMKITECVCGLLMLGIALIINDKYVRSIFRQPVYN